VDTAFFLGIGAAVAGVVIFGGSVWMLMSVVLGGRLAYFITASIMLSFLFIMSIVWSINPLGPVGQLPSFKPQAIGEGTNVNFGSVGSYPDNPWIVPAKDDQEAQNEQSQLQSAATTYLTSAIEAGKIKTFEQASDATVMADSARFIEQGGTKYGAVLLIPLKEAANFTDVDPTQPNTVVAVMRFDPGNKLGMARTIALGTFLLLVVHLFGLSRAERKAGQMTARTA
jgi:hypothetical protein